MNNLQVGIKNKRVFNFSRFILVFHFFNLIFILTNFALNFWGRPELQYVYLAHAGLISLSVLIFPLDKILPEILTLLFLEGQGRIIWNYQAWSRIIFDVILLLAVIKIFISNKKLYKKEVVPKAFMALIVCHFLWYLIQIFNVNAASVVGAIAAIKIYIFPILLFLGLTQTNLGIKRSDFNYVLGFFVLIFILELALNIFQVQEKQILLYKISPYYFKAMTNGLFSGHLFRPFATTFIPGGLSTLIYLTIGLLYLKPLNIGQSLLRYVLIAVSIINLILGQVRSALIKYILILLIIHIGTLLYHRLNSKKLFPYILALLFLAGNLDGLLSKLPMLNDKNLEYAIARTSSLADTNKLKGSRISTERLGSVLAYHLSKYPLGVGPAMTGAASSINAESLARDPVINAKSLWTHDNLFVSLAIELGYGAIFYIILLGLIPVYFTQKLIKLYRDKEEEKFRVVLVCVASLSVIIVGNWGAVAVTYNPESFIFWLFAAIGFYTLADQKKIS